MLRRRATFVLAAAALATALGGASAEGAERTGRWLVVLKDAKGETARASASGVAGRAGARIAGRGAPRLGIATIDGSRAAIAAARRDPAVDSVTPEYAREPRLVPNDPAIGLPGAGLPPGVSIQWALAREGFPAAWDVSTGAAAIVGMVDTGVDSGHPEIGGKVAASREFGTASGALSDEDGHGTHVSGLACAATNNGIGVAGAGFNCRLAVAKTPLFRDEDIVNGILFAVSQGAQAVNMSFGSGPPSPAFDQAINFALSREVVLVAAAANIGVVDQGAPASQLQPGNSADITQGRGLVVTATDFTDARAGTGLGPQISMAAYGFFREGQPPPGLVSTYPSQRTAREIDGCLCRTAVAGDDRYAYLQGTSMAVPQVAAAAALLAGVNPLLTAREKMTTLKQTARRAAGWTSELGWGILNAGAAVEVARRIDKTAPASVVRSRRRVRLRGRGRGRPRVRLRLRIALADPAGPGEGVIPSGVRSVELYLRRGRGRLQRVREGPVAPSVALRLRRPGRYRLYTVAVDAAGNREADPARADAVVHVLKARRR